MIKTFYCFRHGQTDWNKEGKFQGSKVDLSLNETGRQQALEIPHFNIGVIYSSPLKRAFETANIYNEKHNVEVIIDERLKEVDYGDWAGITKWQIIDKYGDEVWKRYSSAKPEDDDFKIPNGSIKREARDGVISALEKIGKSESFDCIGVFAHGRILALIANKLSTSDEPIPIIKNSEHIEITYNTETEEIKLVESDK